MNGSGTKNEGFTLLEVFLSIALISILVSAFFSVFTNFRASSDLDMSAQTLVQTLRRAQLLSQGSANDSDWGVKTEDERVVLFQGASFAERDETGDEIIEFPSPLSASGDTEIVFRKFSGKTAGAGSVTLFAGSGAHREISFNEMGTVSY